MPDHYGMSASNTCKYIRAIKHKGPSEVIAPSDRHKVVLNKEYF